MAISSHEHEGGDSTGNPDHDDQCADQPAAPLPGVGLGDEQIAVMWCWRSHLHGTMMSSTMVEVKIDRGAGVNLHLQVAASLRRAIAEGEAGPGDRLPPAADLAAVLGVNKNTVLRALRDLRDEGVVEFRRGRGVTVTATSTQSEILQASRDLLALAARNGYERRELLHLIATLPA
jgi:GntR family transcriptional regulator